MAGKVAKYGTLSMSYGTGKSNSEYHDDATKSGSGNGKSINARSGNIMEDYLLIDEDVIIKSLGIELEREKALRYLDRQFRENNSLLIFQNKLLLFQGFAQTLCAEDINVRIECTKLIAKIIPQLGPDLEQCMRYVLPKIVSNIGNITALQKESIQTLHICMKQSADVYQILRVIAANGIKHEDPKTRKQIIHTFPTLLFPEFKNEDFFDIVMALTQSLNDVHSDNSKVLKTLSQVKKFVGGQRFASYIHDLPSPLQSMYNEMMMLNESNALLSNRSTPSLLHESFSNGDLSYQDVLSSSLLERNESTSSRNISDFGKSGYFDSSSMKNSLGKGFKVRPNYLTPARSPEMLQPLSSHYEFGFISKSIIENLSSTDNKTRYQAVEDLKTAIANMRDITALKQNIIATVSLLQPVIEDNYYRVSCGALQALGLIIQKVGPDVRPYVKLIITAAAKRIGSKDVIRAECMKVLLALEEVTDSATVLEHFWNKLQHKQAKIREETLHLVIASLLKFPITNNNISVPKLCNMVAPMLIDPKPKVRQATLECLSIVANTYGQQTKEYKALLNAIDQLEIMHEEGSGVMSAVLARFVRRQLPKLRENMLVEYGVIPSSSAYNLASPNSADINWVLSAGQLSASSSQSSLSHFSSSVNGSFTNSSESSEIPEVSSSEQRRHPSAGKRAGVFPWAREKDNSEKHPSSAPVQTQRTNLGETHPPPIRPRNTWGPESQEKLNSSITGQQQARTTRPHRVADPTTGAGGGYLEIHQRKQANAVKQEPLTHVGTPVRQRKQVDGESTGLHSAPTMGRNMSVSDAGGYQPSFGSNDVTARHPRPNLGSLKTQNDVLSNSCPTTFFEDNPQVARFNKSSRRSPLASVSNEPTGQKAADEIINEPESPIHLKPQLARSSAKRRSSPNGTKQENQLSVQTPLKLKNSASPRLDRIADNPTVENVRPIIKQNRSHNALTTDSKLNSSYTDILDPHLSASGAVPASSYTPSGLQGKPSSNLNSTLPMAVIRHPSHQMKSTTGSSTVKNASNGSVFPENDANNNAVPNRKAPTSNKYIYDHYPESGAQPKARSKSDSHGPLRSSKSLPAEAYPLPADLITHPRLLQKTSAPIQSDTPRTAPHAGIREDDIPKSSMDLIRHSAQKKRNQMQRSLSSGKELSAMAGLDGSMNSTMSGPSSGRATAPESGSNNTSGILSPISNKSNSHSPSPVTSTSRDSLENFFINGYQSTQNRRTSRTDSEPSSTYSTDTGYVSTVNDQRKIRKSSKIDLDSSLFMTKPSIARPGSGKSNGNGYSPISTSRENTSTDPPPFKYNPNAGVSFNTQKTKSNLPVVGFGYGLRSPSSSEATVTGSSPIMTPTNSSTSVAISPGSSSLNSKPSQTSLVSNQSSKERRRSQRGSSVGLSMTAFDPNDNFNVKGRAIRDTSSTNLSDLPDYSPTPSKEDLPPWSSQSNDSLSNHPPDAVYGKAVRHPSASSDISNEEKHESVPLSASLLAHQLKKKDDLEQFRRTKKGKMKSQGSEQELTLEEKLSALNIDNKPPPPNFNATGPLQPSKSKSLRKSRSPNSKISPPRAASLDRRSGSRDSSALRNTTEILPCTNPEALLNDAIVGLQNRKNSEEWEEICNHLHTFRRLANHHQEVLGTRMHEVLQVVLASVSNLRSQVSRAAVMCLSDIYTHMRKPAIDTDIEATTRALLTSYGRNTGAFMQEEITKTLQYIVANVTSLKVLNSLLTVGSGNRNTSVRDLRAQFVSLLVEKMGPGKALSGVKDTTDKIIPAASQFITDPSQVTRYYGRCILQYLMTHQDFEKCIDKYLGEKQAKEMKESVQNIKTRGVGTLGSAGTRNPGSGVRRNGSTKGATRNGNSANSERLPQISSKSSRRSTPGRPTFNDLEQEEIRVMVAKMADGDLQARREALSDLREKLEINRPLVEENIVKIMDGLRSLLTTANSKLNYLGLEMIILLIPELGNQLPPTDLVPTVCRLLVSKQQNTAQLALKAVNEMLEHIDHMMLLPQFATCAMYSPGKTKQVCIEKLAELVRNVSARKPQAVERHVLPVLLSLMSEKHAMNLKRETTILAKALHEVIGDGLLQYAEAKNVKSKIVDMIES